MSNDVVTYLIPPGSIRCYITGTLRKDAPEENVRQRWARSLVDEYGYSKADIAIEFPIQMGAAKKRADIVIFKPGAKQVQGEIVIITETKRDDINLSDKNKGEGQLKSYMAACVSCKYGLWVGTKSGRHMSVCQMQSQPSSATSPLLGKIGHGVQSALICRSRMTSPRCSADATITSM